MIHDINFLCCLAWRICLQLYSNKYFKVYSNISLVSWKLCILVSFKIFVLVMANVFLHNFLKQQSQFRTVGLTNREQSNVFAQSILSQTLALDQLELRSVSYFKIQIKLLYFFEFMVSESCALCIWAINLREKKYSACNHLDLYVSQQYICIGNRMICSDIWHKHHK